MRTLNIAAATLAAVSLLAAAPAMAQTDWPTRTVTMVVPVAAGGGADPLARLLAEQLSQRLGQSFVVDFRPGAGMMLGTSAVAKSAPDGYTILFTQSSAIVNAAANPNATYDPVNDFIHVSRTNSLPSFIHARIDAPYNTYDEMIAYAKANPGKVNWAVPGIGTTGHLSVAIVQARAGVEFNLVPYSGTGAVLPDLISGVVDIATGAPTAFLGAIQNGRAKYIAVLAAERFPMLPDVPATGESKSPSAFASSFYVVSLPKGTPKAIADKLGDAVRASVKDAEVGKKLNTMGYTVIGDSADDAVKAINRDIAELKEMVAAGVFKFQ